MNRQEKIDLLVWSLKDRLERYEPFKKQMKHNFDTFANSRKKFAERIEKYKDDKVIVDMLQSNVEYIDKQYEKELSQFEVEMNKLDRSMPKIEVLIEVLSESSTDLTVAELFIDLFLETALKDWEDFKNMKQEEEQTKEVS